MLYLAALLIASVRLVSADRGYIITKSIEAVGSRLSILHTDVDSVKGGPQGFPYALQVQLDAVELFRGIENTTSAVKASSPLGDSDSNDVASALLNITQPIKESLNDIQSKAGVFAELSPIVLASLHQLKQSTDELGRQIIDKLSEPYKSVAPEVVQQIDDEFDHAIAAFAAEATRDQK